jgi:hypothetical protein
MALEIQFFDHTKETRAALTKFEVRTDPDHQQDWLIPEVLLVSTDRRIYLLTRIEIKVEGEPANVRGRIEAAYFTRSFDPPIAVSAPYTLLGIKATDAGYLPLQVDCVLKVTAHYYDSERGQAVGVAQSLTRNCGLFRGAESVVPIPVLVPRPAEVRVDGDTGTSLFVDVVRGPDGTQPRLRLAYPETVFPKDDPVAESVKPYIPELKEALTKALAVAPRGSTKSLNGETRTFQYTIAPQLARETRNGLSQVEEKLVVPLVTDLPGTKAQSVGHQLVVKASENEFLFWLVIDFGTTNSTVTVHAQFTQDDPNGLPDEQHEKLRQSLSEWFDLPASEALPGGNRFESEWEKLTREVANYLDKSSGGRPSKYLEDPDPARLYKAIIQLEVTLRGKVAPFRSAVYSRLHEHYHTALRVPSLKRRKLYPVTLDRLLRQKPIESFMEVLKVDLPADGEKLVRVLMGNQAKSNFRGAIAATGPDADLNAIRSRFHASPKRYFGTDEKLKDVVLADGTRHSITVDDLMKAGWGHLIDLTEQARDLAHEFEGEGKFRKAVITYPTAAPPAVRQKIEELMAELQVHDVRTDYDEAVAAAIFYLMREYSGATEIGLESFKTRARELRPGEWVQNLLVFDIGGGTTDVALIELKLVEPAVFEPKEDRGAGGRYYRFLPKLRSSTGHMQLGGELMTLRLFHFLKAKLADRLLTLVQNKKLKSSAIDEMFKTTRIPDTYREGEKYREGSLCKPFATETWDLASPEIAEARKLAEEILPTCWSAPDVADRSNRLQAFYTLWELADEAKKKLGARRPEGESQVAGVSSATPDYLFSKGELKQFMELCRPELGTPPEDVLRLSLSTADFEMTIRKVVDDAVAIAKGTLEHLPAGHKVDWLILSGQSCNLALVDRTIREQFQKSDRFVWNPERVTFDRDYAKLATSLGACFAEEYRRRNITPRGYVPNLRRGEFVLDYDIYNLFSNLPCNLFVSQADGIKGSVLFESGTELTEIEPPGRGDDQRAKARTKWLHSAITMTVMRSDFKEDPNNKRRQSITWGNLDVSKLLKDIEMSDNEWRSKVKVLFEVDHRLDMVVYACRLRDSQEADREITGREPSVKFNVRVPAAAPAADAPSPTPLRAQRPGTPEPPAQPPTAPAPPPPPGLFDEQQNLRYDIAIRLPNTDTVIPLFRKGKSLNSTFHFHGQNSISRPGMLGEGFVEQLPTDGPNADPYEVFARQAKEGSWALVGRIRLPESRPVFKRRCHFTLDSEGVMRIHEGEPPYHLSPDPSVLQNKPGVVFRRSLDPGVRNQDRNRNPFNGWH